MMDDRSFGRLTYLVRELQLPLPPAIANFLPGGRWLGALKSLADPLLPDQSADQAIRLYKLGATMGPPSVEELHFLIVSLLEREGTLTGPQWLEVAKVLTSMNSGAMGLQESIERMDSLKVEEYHMFPSGFVPLDSVLGGGLSSGIYTFIGAPGSGKSSMMMMIAEALRLTLPEDTPLLYVQTELPPGVFKSRISPVIKRTAFKPIDTLVCAPWSSQRIIDYLSQSENANPNTIVIYDSPDPMLLATSESSARFAIAQTWLDFIRIKQSLAPTILVTSWSRRGEGTNLSMESGAEGAAKERYSDAVIGINQEAGGTIRLECYKNRFGQVGNRQAFRPDWANLRLEVL